MHVWLLYILWKGCMSSQWRELVTVKLDCTQFRYINWFHMSPNFCIVFRHYLLMQIISFYGWWCMQHSYDSSAFSTTFQRNHWLGRMVHNVDSVLLVSSCPCMHYYDRLKNHLQKSKLKKALQEIYVDVLVIGQFLTHFEYLQELIMLCTPTHLYKALLLVNLSVLQRVSLVLVGRRLKVVKKPSNKI